MMILPVLMVSGILKKQVLADFKGYDLIPFISFIIVKTDPEGFLFRFNPPVPIFPLVPWPIDFRTDRTQKKRKLRKKRIKPKQNKGFCSCLTQDLPVVIISELL
jgi:hypothetical protein